MMAHVESPPPSVVERRPDLPRAFDEVVRRAMAKDPAERYPSAGDLGEAALVAAGELRRAREESVVATGEAASFLGAPGLPAPARPRVEVAAAPAGAPAARAEPTPEPASQGGSALRWGFALAILALLAVGMFVALGALDQL